MASTEFHKSYHVNDGYNGSTAFVYLCYCFAERRLLAVHSGGWYHIDHVNQLSEVK